jgi:hypothetical protein
VAEPAVATEEVEAPKRGDNGRQRKDREGRFVPPRDGVALKRAWKQSGQKVPLKQFAKNNLKWPVAKRWLERKKGATINGRGEGK